MYRHLMYLSSSPVLSLRIYVVDFNYMRKKKKHNTSLSLCNCHCRLYRCSYRSRYSSGYYFRYRDEYSFRSLYQYVHCYHSSHRKLQLISLWTSLGLSFVLKLLINKDHFTNVISLKMLLFLFLLKDLLYVAITTDDVILLVRDY